MPPPVVGVEQVSPFDLIIEAIKKHRTLIVKTLWNHARSTHNE